MGRCYINCDFLEFAASLTQCQSGSSYATQIVVVKAVNMTLSKCLTVHDNNHAIPQPFSQKMLNVLIKYDDNLRNESAQSATILDPRVSSDTLTETEILGLYVVLALQNNYNLITTSTEVEPKDSVSSKCIYYIFNKDYIRDELYD